MTAAAAALSVIIPVYNRKDMIRDCLKGFLGTEATGTEVIVVDDGSGDGSPEVVEQLAATSRGARIRLVRQANAGPGAARNHGVRLAKGDWIAFLDSDDMWMPWTLTRLRALLAGAADAQVFFLRTRHFDSTDAVAQWTEEPVETVVHATMLDMRVAPCLPLIGSCNVVLRRDLFESLGGFTDEVRCGEDTDLFYRAGLAGPVVSVTAPVMVAYRANNSDSITRRIDFLKAQTRFLLRRNREGTYPGPVGLREKALCTTLLFAIRNFFAEGSLDGAYGAYLAGFPLLWRQRDWHNLIRVPLTPLLSLIRPQNYRVRWRRPTG